MNNLKFLTSKTFILTVLLQVAGPFAFTFGNWANVIQYASGFGMAYAFWHYLKHHKLKVNQMSELTALVRRMTHQSGALHEQVKELKNRPVIGLERA